MCFPGKCAPTARLSDSTFHCQNRSLVGERREEAEWSKEEKFGVTEGRAQANCACSGHTCAGPAATRREKKPPRGSPSGAGAPAPAALRGLGARLVSRGTSPSPPAVPLPRPRDPILARYSRLPCAGTPCGTEVVCACRRLLPPPPRRCPPPPPAAAAPRQRASSASRHTVRPGMLARNGTARRQPDGRDGGAARALYRRAVRGGGSRRRPGAHWPRRPPPPRRAQPPRPGRHKGPRRPGRGLRALDSAGSPAGVRGSSPQEKRAGKRSCHFVERLAR